MSRTVTMNIWIVFVLLASFPSSYSTDHDGETVWKKKMEEIQKYVEENNIIEEDNALQQYEVGLKYFNLSMICSEKPTSVHRLRPQDIDVVGAMGDSITAANGANASTVVGVAREYRGLSWSIGGEGELENTITLPNILKLFNPNLTGYSIGTRVDENRDWTFNVAVPGAKVNEMTAQAEKLVNAMKNDGRVNFEEDWKLVTIFIGGNDLCDLDIREESKPQNFIASLKEALDYLHQHMSRTLVNVINILEIHHLRDVGTGFGGTAVCRTMQRLLCRYIVTANDTELESIITENKEYQTLTEELIMSGRYDTREDFTVVLQPFLEETVLPYTENGEVDATYFAPDCFHFSTKGHAIGAVNLWNNMLEPVGQKHKEWIKAELKCPTADSPFIFTNKNSVGTIATTSSSTKSTATSLTTTSAPISTSCVTSQTDIWVIILTCILGVAFLIQTVILVILLRNKSERKSLL